MGKRPVVVVTDYLTESGPEQTVLGEHAELRLLGTNDEAVVIERGADADALLVYHDIKLSQRTLTALPKLKGVVRCGVGYDNVDIRIAGGLGIVVCNVPDYGTEDVADHALMMLLAIARRLVHAHQRVCAGEWSPNMTFGSPRLRGQTMGIIGCGNIGSAFALRAKALGMRVLFFDPYKPIGYDKSLGIERCFSLDELMSASRFVSIHCPLTPETRHIINRATLSKLPDGAYLVNTARGPCVDADALLEALATGKLTAAALDVFEKEPLEDDRLRNHPKLLVTPHVAYYSVDGFVEMRTKGAQEAKRILLGEPVRNLVNREFLQNPRTPIPSPITIA